MAPFPWLPMIAISTGLISHSYALTNLFPYVGFMVQGMGVTDDKDKAGESCRIRVEAYQKDSSRSRSTCAGKDGHWRESRPDKAATSLRVHVDEHRKRSRVMLGARDRARGGCWRIPASDHESPP